MLKMPWNMRNTLRPQQRPRLYKIVRYWPSNPYLLSFLGGVISALTYFSSTFFFLALLGTGLFLYTLNPTWGESSSNEKRPSLIKQLVLTFSFLMAINLFAFYWIAETAKEFGDIPFPLNYGLLILFTFICVPQYWTFPFLFKIREKYLPYWKIPLSLQHLLLAMLMTLLDYFTPQQFPTSIGTIYYHLRPYLGLAPIGGVPLFAFMSFYLILATISLIRYKKWDQLAFGQYALFIILNVGNPLTSSLSLGGQEFNVRLVQANVGNFLKISSELGDSLSLAEVTQRYRNLSLRPYPYGKNPDLMIWPETAYPYLFTEQSLKENRFPELFQEVQAQSQAEIFFGGYLEKSRPKYQDWDFEQVYNVGFFINHHKKIEDPYRKKILLPFGETLPFPTAFNHWLGKYINSISYFAAGEGWNFFETKNGLIFVPTICYELLLSPLIREALNHSPKEPHFIINITNDSWFGKTVEPEQHLMLAKWRALEYLIPVIRSTNTGITTIIDRNGIELKRLPLDMIDIIDYKMIIPKRFATIYQQWGIGATLLYWSLVFILAVGLDTRVIRPE